MQTHNFHWFINKKNSSVISTDDYRWKTWYPYINLGKWFNMQKSPIVLRLTITSFLVCSSCMGVVVILIISIHNFFHSDNSIKSQPTFLLGWQPTIRVCQLIFTDSAPRLIQSIGLNVCLCVCPLLWDPEPCGLETSGWRAHP